MPADLAERWNFDPLLLAGLAAAFIVCRAASGRSAALVAGFIILAVLFLSPLCALSSALFAVRATHHVALTALAAPLIALALPLSQRNLTAWTLSHAAVFWAWHAPQAYGVALASHSVFWLMQLTILGTAIALWRGIRGAPATAGLAALLATMVQMGLLGALLTFSGSPLYDWHAMTTLPWGLSPIEDQQLAGLIMWVPGAGLYLAAALWLANCWFAERQRAAAA